MRRKLALCGGSAFHEQQVLASEDDFGALVESLAGFNNDSVRGSFRVVAFFFDRNDRVNRISDKDRLDEAEAIVSIRHGVRINGASRQTYGDTEHERAMGDTLAKWLLAAPFGVHVMRVEIASLTGVEDNIGLSDCPAVSFAAFFERVVLKIPFRQH